MEGQRNNYVSYEISDEKFPDERFWKITKLKQEQVAWEKLKFENKSIQWGLK